MYIDLADLKRQLAVAVDELEKHKKELAQARYDAEEAISRMSYLKKELAQYVETVIELQNIEQWLETNGALEVDDE